MKTIESWLMLTSFADINIMQSFPSAPELSTLIEALDSCRICLMIPPPFPITPPMFAMGQTKRREKSFAEASSLWSG
jgi:hypothetical protein